jgi:hypothetical protein
VTAVAVDVPFPGCGNEDGHQASCEYSDGDDEEKGAYT